MSTPRTSVIITCYNLQKYIGRSIRSLINQSLNDDEYEIIVIDDKSTDNSLNVISNYLSNIKLIKNEKNLGLSASLNSAIKYSTGKYVIRVDGDDYVHSDFLKILCSHLDINPNLDAVYCDYQEVAEDEKIIRIVNADEYPIGCGILFNSLHLFEMGLYDETLHMHEERDLRLRFEKKYNLYRVPLALYRYRKHKKSLTSDNVSFQKHLKILNKKHKFI